MPRTDAYQDITDQIIEAMEAGTPPWRKPWTGDKGVMGFPTRSSGELYRGINVVVLWLSAEKQGFSSSHWFTYKQATEAGGQVRKGQKATKVVYYGTLEREDDAGEDVKIPYLKSYSVFNAEQIDGLPEEFYSIPEPARDLGTRSDPTLDKLFHSMDIPMITTDESRAYYRPSVDQVHLPPVQTFHDASAYYATWGHENVHATGATKRLNRNFDAKKTAYAFEELIAEIGQVMLCARLGLVPDFEQSAAYLESWLKCLKDDKKAIFQAASQAQKAVDYLFKAIEDNTIVKEAA